MATAVARAGGLGTISSAWLGTPERAGRAIEAIGDVGAGALAVNTLECISEQVDLIEAAAARVRVIDFFWG